MKVKKYLAPTLPEAMAKVRQELGRDAIILHTQRVKVPGMMGLLGRTQVEVTAATDDLPSGALPAAAPVVPVAPTAPAAPAPSLPPAPVQPASGGGLLPSFGAMPLPAQGAGAFAPAARATLARGGAAAPAVAGLAAQAQPAAAPPAPQAGNVVPFPRPPEPAADLQSLQDELNHMKSLMNQVIRRMEVPGAIASHPEPLRRLYADLTAAGVQAELAGELIAELSHDRRAVESGGDGARSALLEIIGNRIGPGRAVELPPPGRGRRVVALIGPTGVGKTTTLAKLAAYFALAQKRSVALVTADTYRIAAVEQLRTYGEIIGVPVDVVFTPAELKVALARHESRDVVFIDTAGRSHKNAMQMSELRGLLEAARPNEVHLVLSLTTNLREAQEVLQSFEPAGYGRLLLTKLDENSSPGQVLNLAVAANKPLSYITTGQNVPDDMELADPHGLAKAILGG